MSKIDGIDEICFICQKRITIIDIEENNNGPYKAMSIPGWIHKKCKIDFSSQIINTGFNAEVLDDGYGKNMR